MKIFETGKIISKRIIYGVDWWLIVPVAGLMGISFLAIYSAGANCASSSRYIAVQSLASAIGFIGLIFLACFNYQNYKYMDKVVYILSVALLILVLIFGSAKRGTKGWFDFGSISFQPVEITKIMFVLVFTSFLDRKANGVKGFFFLVSAIAIPVGHLFLIMMQPDFSSTLSYFPVTLVLLFITGIKPFYLICIIILGALAAGIPLLGTFFNMQSNGAFLTNSAISLKTGNTVSIFIAGLLFSIILIWRVLWGLRIRISIVYPVFLCTSIFLGCLASVGVEKSLKDYQRKRLVVFLNPKIDPKGSGYNIIQSKIAIGSGKLTGRGFKKGPQTQLGFLPERHTDFIFSVIGEEGGWFISQLTLLFYFILIWRALIIAKTARDRYGSLVAIGLATMVAFYVVINIGMVMGIMPVTGMPLLFLSYGGSSIFSSLCIIGILCSINMRRHINILHAFASK